MTTVIRVVDLAVKAAGPDDGLEEGEFIGYASVFNNVDSYGDMVIPGAFTNTLKEWEDSKNLLPCLWGHDMKDPFSNIGWVKHAEEDEKGLKVHVHIDLEDNPTAKQVYRLIKGRRVAQMSFAYDVLEASMVEKTEEGKTFYYYELRELKLYEVSVVPIGANQETELLAVKARADRIIEGVKAGRVLSAKNEGILKDAHSELTAAAKRIGDVLAQVAQEDEEKASTDSVEVKSEEPSETTRPANDEEPPEVSVEPESEEAEDPSSEEESLRIELELLQLVNSN